MALVRMENGDRENLDELRSLVNDQLRHLSSRDVQVVELSKGDRSKYEGRGGNADRRVSITLEGELPKPHLVHELAHDITSHQIPNFEENTGRLAENTYHEAFSFLNSLYFTGKADTTGYYSEGSEAYQNFWDEVENAIDGLDYESIEEGCKEIDTTDLDIEMKASEFLIKQLSHIAGGRMAKQLSSDDLDPREMLDYPSKYFDLSEDYIEEVVQRGLVENNIEKKLTYIFSSLRSTTGRVRSLFLRLSLSSLLPRLLKPVLSASPESRR